jgi:hypothetical protein
MGARRKPDVFERLLEREQMRAANIEFGNAPETPIRQTPRVGSIVVQEPNAGVGNAPIYWMPKRRRGIVLRIPRSQQWLIVGVWAWNAQGASSAEWADTRYPTLAPGHCHSIQVPLDAVRVIGQAASLPICNVRAELISIPRWVRAKQRQPPIGPVIKWQREQKRLLQRLAQGRDDATSRAVLEARAVKLDHLLGLGLPQTDAGSFVRVEYDPNFHGGSYKGVGRFELIPLRMIKKIRTQLQRDIQSEAHAVPEAFEQRTGLARENIIHYSESELFDWKGKPR